MSGTTSQCSTANIFPVSTETGDHLVCYEQDAVPITDVPQHGPVFIPRNYCTLRQGHGLGDDGRDGLGPVEVDELLDRLGAPDGALGGSVSSELASIRVGLGSVHHAGVHGLEILSRRRCISTQPQDPPGRAVIGAPPAYHLIAPGLAPATMVRPGNLQRSLICLGPAADRKDTRQATRSDAGQLLGQLDSRDRSRTLREVSDLEHLLVSRLGDLGPAVSDVDRVVAAVYVEPRTALRVGDPDTMALDHHRRIAFLGHLHPVAAVHPQISQRRLTNGLAIRSDNHRSSPDVS